MHSKVFKLAHEIRNEFATWSEALKLAWAKVKLQQALASGECKFTFKKKDGSLRPATGTLDQSKFNYEYKGISQSTKWYIQKYFDLDKQAFRSCDVRRLVKV